MTRHDMVERVGKEFLTSNIESGEYSYVQEAGSKAKLEKAVGHSVYHYKLDIRFEKNDTVVLIETKQTFTKADEKQIADYLKEEKALHSGKKIICILANTNDDKIKVWKSAVDDEHLLTEETVLDTMIHYEKLFEVSKQNDRQKVLKNTYALNELLHKMDIDENKRSQFVGTCLLYIKDKAKKMGLTIINDDAKKQLDNFWNMLSSDDICSGIKSTLNDLLDGSENKKMKIDLLQKNVLDDQKIKKLKLDNWKSILDTILMDIYKYIDADSSEGQDILNIFFIAFNKYTGKADKNQAFTPDHITNFMSRLTGVDRTKIVMDITCGSGSFLVQAMVKELADCNKVKATEDEIKVLKETVKQKHIYGIECEEKAYGLATTNMLIHGDGNSNIKFGSCFDNKKFIQEANPDIILMNPPYNAKPISIPEKYKKKWEKAKDGKADPTKGLVFVKYLSDIVAETNALRIKNGESIKTITLAVLLPVSAAIGTSKIISDMKTSLLEENTLEAVFTLPNEVFYPGASVSACCMLFTLGKPHDNETETFFGYCKEDGFKKKKNLGRIEQFDSEGNSIWKSIEDKWLKMYKYHKSEPGLSSVANITGSDEWLCEAYMKTDYSKLTKDDFQQTLNNYLAYQLKEGKIYES